MKYFLALLVLPALASAQAPEGQGQPPSFDQFRQAMLPVIEQSLPAMQQTRECVAQSDSKEATVECMQKMADMARSLQAKMGAPAGAGATPPPANEMVKPPEGFEWNQETKQRMLQEMDRSIQQSVAMQECLQGSKTGEEMGNCMRSKQPAPPKP
jgi:hypothetical protein